METYLTWPEEAEMFTRHREGQSRKWRQRGSGRKDCWAQAVNMNCCCSNAQLWLTLCDPKDCSTPGFRPSLSPGVYANPCPSSQWCHPTISSSATPFSSCPQSVMWIKGGKGIRRDQEGYHCRGRLWKALAATLWGDAACAEGMRMWSLVLAVCDFIHSINANSPSRKAFLVWNKMSSLGT